MGSRGSRHSGPDLGPLIAQHNQNLENLRSQLTAAANADKAALQAQIDAVTTNFAVREEELQDINRKLQQELATVAEQLSRPGKLRAQKKNFVNRLLLNPRLTDKILLLGHKGLGKTSFLWLLGVGPKPEPSTADGTTRLHERGPFIDTIGMPGWDVHYVAKMLVLLLDFGIPKDVLVFGNDRVVIPLTALGAFGIISPLVVCMNPGGLWKGLNGGVHPVTRKLLPPSLSYTTNAAGVKVFPMEKIDQVYDGDAMERVVTSGFGICLTHQTTEAFARVVTPFKTLTDCLPFQASDDQMDMCKEALFRFIYIYFKNYRQDIQNGQRNFLNNATLAEFDEDVKEGELERILAGRAAQDMAIAEEIKLLESKQAVEDQHKDQIELALRESKQEEDRRRAQEEEEVLVAMHISMQQQQIPPGCGDPQMSWAQLGGQKEAIQFMVRDTATFCMEGCGLSEAQFRGVVAALMSPHQANLQNSQVPWSMISNRDIAKDMVRDAVTACRQTFNLTEAQFQWVLSQTRLSGGGGLGSPPPYEEASPRAPPSRTSSERVDLTLEEVMKLSLIEK